MPAWLGDSLSQLVSICLVFPWPPSSQELEPPENPGRFNPATPRKRDQPNPQRFGNWRHGQDRTQW